MTRSRISMVVAAGALVLVGLLAAALFSPSKDDTPAEAPGKKEEVAKVAPKKQPPVVTDNKTPQVTSPAAAPTVTANPAPVAQPQPQPPAPQKPQVIDYTIKHGDMISKLASRYGVKKADIYALNPELDDKTAGKIRAGAVIRIPTGPGAVLEEKADTGPRAEYFPRLEVEAEPGDNAYDLALQHYGKRSLFDRIIRANPRLPWGDGLKGGERVVIPQVGTAPDGARIENTARPEKSAPVGQRESLIPARK